MFLRVCLVGAILLAGNLEHVEGQQQTKTFLGSFFKDFLGVIVNLQTGDFSEIAQSMDDFPTFLKQVSTAVLRSIGNIKTNNVKSCTQQFNNTLKISDNACLLNNGAGQGYTNLTLKTATDLGCDTLFKPLASEAEQILKQWIGFVQTLYDTRHGAQTPKP